MPGDAPLLSVRGLRGGYRKRTVLQGVDFDVAQGEIFGLLGPNGAGKTTTVEILEGYRGRSAGEVRVLGHDPADGDPAFRDRIGIVLQSTGVERHLTATEAVALYAGYYARPRPAADLLDLVGLTGSADVRVGRLSGGQRRRLDLAIALAGSPEIVFLDEPTTGFDPEARREFWTLIERLKAERTTILLTTHYLDEAERLADRVAVIARGRIIAMDAPGQLGSRGDGTAMVTWMEDGVEQRRETDHPTRLVRELGARFPDEIPQLSIRRPTLEDTYLALLASGEGGED